MKVEVYIKDGNHSDRGLLDVSKFELTEDFLIVKSERWNNAYYFSRQDIVGFKVEYDS